MKPNYDLDGPSYLELFQEVLVWFNDTQEGEMIQTKNATKKYLRIDPGGIDPLHTLRELCNDFNYVYSIRVNGKKPLIVDQSDYNDPVIRRIR